MEYARIIITDPLGRDLFILPVANRPGRQEVNVERDMEPGMYAYRLELDGRIIATNKLMVLR